MRKRAWVLGLGVLLGEAAFLLAYPGGEDFWAHYLWNQGLLGRLTAEQIAAVWPYPVGFDDWPGVSVLTLPLAFLARDLALRIWIFLSLIALEIAVIIMSQKFLPLQDRREAAILFLIWPPSFEALFRGQTSPWWLLGLAVALAYILQEKAMAGGAVLAWATGIKPHLTVPWLLGALMRKRGGWLWGFVAVLVLLVPLSLIGWEWMPDISWPAYLSSWFFHNSLSVSLVGRLYFLPWTVQAILSGFGFLALGFWWWRSQPTTPWEAGLGLVASLLLTPHLRAYDLVILTPVYFLLWQRRDGLFWASWVLVSMGSLGALRFALGDLIPLGLIILAFALWRQRAAVDQTLVSGHNL